MGAETEQNLGWLRYYIGNRRTQIITSTRTVKHATH
jgi:hypothetical protein